MKTQDSLNARFSKWAGENTLASSPIILGIGFASAAVFGVVSYIGATVVAPAIASFINNLF